MSLFAIIDREAKARGLEYLVIGGYAVIAHGYPRLTFDLDIAIERTQQEEWLQLAGSLGYVLHHDGGAFLQLTSEEQRWPLDLMLVNESTFAKLTNAAVERDFEKVRVPVVSLLHLVAMKVHAMKNTRTRRFLKNFQDVMELIARNRIDLATPSFEGSSSGMGLPNSTTKSSAPAQTTDDLFEGVEFPVAPDFISVLPAGTMADVYRAAEAVQSAYLQTPGERERRKADVITAEFAL
jgi:hypothetical protein